MPDTIRVIRAEADGWNVATAEEGSVIAWHASRPAAVQQARQELMSTGGGSLVIVEADGSRAVATVHRQPPTQWFDSFVPYLLLLVPGALTLLFGDVAPALFAPAVLASDGTVFGVALATFVLSAGAAVTVAWGMIVPEDLGGPNILIVAVIALLAANGLTILLGTGTLDIFAIRPEWMPMNMGPIGNLVLFIVLFVAAGFLTYGIGGAILGLAAGALAGWRFAVWYLNRP